MAEQHETNDKQIKRVYRSETDKKLAGVCGGIAEYFALDSSLIRIAWVVITILSGVLPGILAYILLATIIPVKSQL
jgi:phage shock protein PspC (stress-responsive transcriptional regulator)